MKVKLKIFFILSLLGVFWATGTSEVAAQPTTARSDDPAGILVSYYDAINNRQFRRAYNYWKNPPQSYGEFVKGYNDTRSVRLITNPNLPAEGGAGSLYKEVPTVLISTMKNGSRRLFYGCYTLRKINLRPPDISKEDTWHIDRGDLKSAPANSDTSKLLAESCGSRNVDPPKKDAASNSSRILGALGSDALSAEQAVSIPAEVRADRDFEITITTTGDGCVGAAETSVILGESGADVFVYDVTSANSPGIFCTMIFVTLPHKATLRFTKSGTATIRVWGRRQGGNLPFGEPIVVTKSVTVR